MGGGHCKELDAASLTTRDFEETHVSEQISSSLTGVFKYVVVPFFAIGTISIVGAVITMSLPWPPLVFFSNPEIVTVHLRSGNKVRFFACYRMHMFSEHPIAASLRERAARRG